MARIAAVLSELSRSGPVATGDLERASGLPESTFYDALKACNEAGIIARDKQGRNTYWSLDVVDDSDYSETTPVGAADNSDRPPLSRWPESAGVASGAHAGTSPPDDGPFARLRNALATCSDQAMALALWKQAELLAEDSPELARLVEQAEAAAGQRTASNGSEA
jgi:hypothetical protein